MITLSRDFLKVHLSDEIMNQSAFTMPSRMSLKAALPNEGDSGSLWFGMNRLTQGLVADNFAWLVLF